MKIAPAVRTALQAIEDRGQATLPQLIADDAGRSTKQSWYTRIWRAKELGLVESTAPGGGCHAATYTVTDAGREVLRGRVIHRGAPPVSMVAQSVRSQPKSVWELGAMA